MSESSLQFFDAVSRWDEIEPHLEDAEFLRTLHEDFGKAIYGRYRLHYPTPDKPLPADWSDPEGTPRLPGPSHPFHQYVAADCCFWLVNSGLRLATLVLSDRAWRIVYSNTHSTVWDGDLMLWDFYGQCFIGDADQAFGEAAIEFPSRHLAPGEYKPVKYAENYHVEVERRLRGTPHLHCPWCGEIAYANGNGSCCQTYAEFMPEMEEGER